MLGLDVGVEGGIAEIAFATIAGEVASVFVASVPSLPLLVGDILAVELVWLGG